MKWTNMCDKYIYKLFVSKYILEMTGMLFGQCVGIFLKNVTSFMCKPFISSFLSRKMIKGTG